MPVASQAQPVIIGSVKVKTMYYTWSIPCSEPWKTSMDKRAPIWDDVIFGHKVAVKQLSLLLGKFSVSAIPSLKSQGYFLCLGISLQPPNMLWGGGTLRQKPNRGQSDEHPGSSVCLVALPTCPGEAINLPIECLSFPSAMVLLRVTAVVSRRAYRTCLGIVPWPVLGNQCTERWLCPPSWEELRFGISPSCGWSFKRGWFCPDASSISSISLDDDNLWEPPPCPLCSCRTTMCSLRRQRSRHDVSERTTHAVLNENNQGICFPDLNTDSLLCQS